MEISTGENKLSRRSNKRKNVKRQLDYNTEKWSLTEFIKNLIVIFILPVFRLSFSAVKFDFHPISHTVIDILVLLCTCGIMGMLHFWKGIIGIAVLLVLALFIGYAIKIRSKDRQKQNNPDRTEKAADCSHAKKSQHSNKPHDGIYQDFTSEFLQSLRESRPPKPKTESKSSTRATEFTSKEGDLNWENLPKDDWESWSTWMQEHPKDFKIVGKGTG